MNDFLELLLIILSVFLVVSLLVIVLTLGSSYLWQSYVKNTWGNFEYEIKQDNEVYYTQNYEIDSRGCVVFIDNYGKNRKWCEKYRVGEFYLHTSSPNWTTIIFGY